jgi:chitinase
MALYAFVDLCWDGKHGNPEPSVNDVAACQEPLNGALAWRDEAGMAPTCARWWR